MADAATCISHAARQRRTCPLCRVGRYERATRVARVRCNVRRWRDHTSTVWQCGTCGSIHALERLDLGPFYQGYPFGQRKLDAFTRRVFGHYLRRLRRHGLRPWHRVLDYGCGNGLLLDFLREQGFSRCAGYDPYSEAYADGSVLTRQYDAVICQDVIEHVEDPPELMRTLARALAPGGLLCIGTPRAEGISLQDPGGSGHSLHQPYHVHVLSERALRQLAASAGLEVEHVTARSSCDTPFPFTNWPFLHAYMRAADGTLDAAFGPPQVGLVLRSPRLWLWGLFGYLAPRQDDMIALLRRTRSVPADGGA